MTAARPVTAGTAVTAAVTTLAGGLAMGLVGLAIGLPTGSTEVAVALRGLLPLAFVLLACRVLTGWAIRRSLAEPLLPVLAGAAAGYLADPFSWSGRAGLSQLALGAGVASYLVDLVLWLMVAALGTVWGAAETPQPKASATPYG